MALDALLVVRNRAKEFPLFLTSFTQFVRDWRHKFQRIGSLASICQNAFLNKYMERLQKLKETRNLLVISQRLYNKDVRYKNSITKPHKT